MIVHRWSWSNTVGHKAKQKDMNIQKRPLEKQKSDQTENRREKKRKEKSGIRVFKMV